MSRKIVAEVDIIRLWNFYFESDIPAVRKDIEGVFMAVLGNKEHILRIYNTTQVVAFNQVSRKLRDNGLIISGFVEEFNKTLVEDFADLTFDTGSATALSVIPFKTRTDRDGITAVVTIYGKTEVINGGFLTLNFKRLSMEGWGPMEGGLRGYGDFPI